MRLPEPVSSRVERWKRTRTNIETKHKIYGVIIGKQEKSTTSLQERILRDKGKIIQIKWHFQFVKWAKKNLKIKHAHCPSLYAGVERGIMSMLVTMRSDGEKKAS